MQILKVKATFQKKMDKVFAKLKKQRDHRLLRMAILIVKAYMGKKEEDRKNREIVRFAKEQLAFFKMQRMFRSVVQFSEWQSNWVRNVKNNFKRQTMKNSFRDIYLNTLLGKQLKKQLMLRKYRVIQNIKEEVAKIGAQHQRLKQAKSLRTKRILVQELQRNRIYKKQLRQIKEDLSVRRRFWLRLLAVQNWQLYTTKHLEYKRDPIVCRFVDYEDAVICQDEPGQPFVVFDSNFDHNYFDVNAKSTFYVANEGRYKEKFESGQER